MLQCTVQVENPSRVFKEGYSISSMNGYSKLFLHEGREHPFMLEIPFMLQMLEHSMLDIPSCWIMACWTSLHAGTWHAGHPFMLEHSMLDIPSCWNIPCWAPLHVGTVQPGHPFMLE